MAKEKKKTTKKEEAPKGDKADIIQAVKDMPKASNLVISNAKGEPTKYETVKRDEVVELLKKML